MAFCHMWLLNADILAGNAARQWLALLIAVGRDAGERRDYPPDISKGEQRRLRSIFHNSIVGNFIVYQDGIETHFFIFSFIIFEVGMFGEQ